MPKTGKKMITKILVVTHPLMAHCVLICPKEEMAITQPFFELQIPDFAWK